jgi:thioredoxin 1
MSRPIQTPEKPRMSKVTELNDDNFKQTLQTARTPVLVDFSAAWCGPCKALAPTIDKVAVEYTGKLAVYKVDIDNAQETASSFDIRAVPTCIFFKGSKEVDRFTGPLDLRAIKGHVEKVLA